MHRPRTAPGITAVMLAWFATACESDSDAPTPASTPGSISLQESRNLLIVTVDTLRADHLGCYGYFRDTSPDIDSLAAGSLLFERCYSPIAHTTPSHVSLMTGLYPHEHGILANSVLKSTDVQRSNAFRPSPRMRSFAQVASRKGYVTGGFVSATPVKAITGLSVGFDAWSQPEGHRRPARETNQDFYEFLGQAEGEPWFAWVHYFDPHGPYTDEHPPAPYAERYQEDEQLVAHMQPRGFPEIVSGKHTEPTRPAAVVNVYDGSIRYLNDQLAEMLEELGRRGEAKDTVIVLTADHGQGLGQHEFISHGLVWEEQLWVPLLIRVPGVAPRKLPRPLSTIDILPTVLSFMPELRDDAFLEQCRGRDVLAEDFEVRPVFGMSPPRRGTLGLTSERWKYVHWEGEGDGLFDLQSDPFELNNIRGEHSDVADGMKEQLFGLIDDQKERGEGYQEGQAEGPIMSPQHLAELKALGYVVDEEEDASRSDPDDS